MFGNRSAKKEKLELPSWLYEEARKRATADSCSPEVVIQRSFVHFLEQLDHQETTLYHYCIVPSLDFNLRAHQITTDLASAKLSEVLGEKYDDDDCASKYTAKSPLERIKALGLEHNITLEDIVVNAIVRYLGLSTSISDLFSPTYPQSLGGTGQQSYLNKNQPKTIPAKNPALIKADAHNSIESPGEEPPQPGPQIAHTSAIVPAASWGEYTELTGKKAPIVEAVNSHLPRNR